MSFLRASTLLGLVCSMCALPNSCSNQALLPFLLPFLCCLLLKLFLSLPLTWTPLLCSTTCGAPPCLYDPIGSPVFPQSPNLFLVLSRALAGVSFASSLCRPPPSFLIRAICWRERTRGRKRVPRMDRIVLYVSERRTVLEPGMRGDVACALVFVCSHVSV